MTPGIYSRWNVREFEGREFDDAEGWAWGFVQGVDLCRADWQSLLETAQGQAWYRPIGLLGEDGPRPSATLMAHAMGFHQQGGVALEA